jgi:endoglucanase
MTGLMTQPLPKFARGQLSASASVLFLGMVFEVASAPSESIRMNQWGFAVKGSKQAAIVSPTAQKFAVVGMPSEDTVLTGELGPSATWTAAKESAKLADFSALEKPGFYKLVVPELGESGTFRIDDSVYVDAYAGLSRYFYFNRTSAELTAPFAGPWARQAGHPDNQVRIHASAATTAKPEGTLINASGGWYDAGDYNKYMGPTAVSVALLLSVVEDFPLLSQKVKWNLPESGNALPDVVDEALLGLRFLMRCQDELDGGVYHKITSATFNGFEPPVQDKSVRYAVRKSVTATLAFAAVMAKAARTLEPYAKDLPGFSDSALAAARKAWQWSLDNPTQYYNQTELNKTFKPEIQTGEYGDNQAADEKFWAGIEMGLTTGDTTFFNAVHPQTKLTGTFTVPGWSTVNTYGLFSLASRVLAGQPLPERFAAADVKARVVNLAKTFRTRGEATAFGVRLIAGDFFWGSNGAIATQGLVLALAHRLSGDADLLLGAVQINDYLYGRNATGYSFVTGFGWKAPLFPHHRPSGSDTVDAPVPGMVVGGPNRGRQDAKDGCTYTADTSAAAKSFADLEPCYASNEVTIYWNAPAVYLLGALAAAYEGYTAGIRTQSNPKSNPRRGQRSNRFSVPGTGTRFTQPFGFFYDAFSIDGRR